MLLQSQFEYDLLQKFSKIEMLSIYGMLVLKIDHAILKIDCPAKIHNFRNLFQKMGVWRLKSIGVIKLKHFRAQQTPNRGSKKKWAMYAFISLP